jgi:signal transduction histidine kinase
LSVLAFLPQSSLEAREPRHVLVLSSSERPHAPQAGFADALVRDLTRASREPIQFVEVSIQPVRASEEPPGVATAERIRAAFQNTHFDLVVTIGGPAATFAQQFREQLFGDTPVLVAGVDRRFVTQRAIAANETTVATQHNPALMIEEVLRLLPDTRSVMVVIGKSQLEKFWLNEMQHDFSRFTGRVQFTWTNELSYDEIVERCRTMPPQSAIFYALLSLDGKGEPRVEGDTLASLHAAANAPLFALYGMGSGVVGGPLLSNAQLSQTTTDVALRLLAGEPPADIKTPAQSAGVSTYDARQLRRWHIDEARLAPGSIVLFREPTFWWRYSTAIMVGAAIGAIPLALVLIGGAVTRRRARSRGVLSGSALAPVLDDAPVRMWTSGPDGRRVENGQDPGVDSSWLDAVHPEDRDRCRETYGRALAQHEGFQMEYRTVDGAVERSILDTGVVRFSGDVFDGFFGTAVDITALGGTRAELSNLSRQLMEAQEREHAALARMLHEDVCQRMVALTLRLQAMPPTPNEAEVADIRENLAGLVSEIAAVPDPVHRRLELLGLAAAARRLCEDLAFDDDAMIYFSDHHVPRTVPSTVALALFRALEEATVNALVHSGAREIWVAMHGTPDEVRVSVVDRGTGFDTQSGVGRGLGLVATRERLKGVGGDITIESTPGQGTKVEAWVPLRPPSP